MKKISIAFLAAFLVMTGIRAQTVADGINDLYAGRIKGARATFEKLLAANPNNIDASYWLGQTYIAAKEIPGARDVYSKALMASANAPLLLVGMGQVELNEKKFSEATQRFETAITLTKGKKGDDPVILNAIGRAITNTYTDKEKMGDINYAVQKLEAATQKDPTNPDILVNLGNAYLKQKPGEGGGRAFESYSKADAASPTFAVPSYRLALLFQSQKNWELYEKYLNQAIKKDPRFALAYYELYYYRLGKLDFTNAQDMATKYIANSDPDPQADHFKAQTYWAEKNYDEAIRISKDIIAKAGDQTQPRTYVLLADSYTSKGDTATAKQYIDTYFAKEDPEKISPINIKMRADIYLATPGQEETAIKYYKDAVNADTVLANKLDMLKKVSMNFKTRKMYDKEIIFEQMTLDMKPTPGLTDYFYPTVAYYFAGRQAQQTSTGNAYELYGKSRALALTMQEKFPNEDYGFVWAFNVARAVDTVKRDSIAVPDALKLFQFSQKDSVKFKKNYVDAALYLVDFYVNYGKDAPKALEYISKVVDIEPTNEAYKGIKDRIEKSARQSNPRGANESRSGAASTGATKSQR